MKRLLLIGFLILGFGTFSNAQVDDIYSTGRDQKGSVTDENSERKKDVDNQSVQQNYNNDDVYASNHSNENASSDEYVDYEDESYATRMHRFDEPFYNMGYYSMFYNPFWYNPYWVDPYGGYNPWCSSIGISFGIGPCWSSYWGWNTWFGYPMFGSYWHYPYYGGSWYGSYYGGYWNRYYGGYEGEHRVRGGGVHYGPRVNSPGNFTSTHRGENGLRLVNNNNNISIRSNNLRPANRQIGNNLHNVTNRNHNNVESFRNNQNNGQMSHGNSNVNGNGNRGGLFRNHGNENNGQRVFGGGNRGGNNQHGFGNRINGAVQRKFSNPGGGAAPHNFGGNNRGGGAIGGGHIGGATHSGGGGGSHSSGGGGGHSSGGGGGSHSGGGGHRK